MGTDGRRACRCGCNGLEMVRPAVARFFEPLNADSWVKLSLRPGESRSWHRYQQTEEGWSGLAYTWTHTGDGVRCEFTSDGSDCDGRLSWHSVTWCPLEGLQARRLLWDPSAPPVPDWVRLEASQRDYQAEAAGY